ncbi:DUF2569 domain-containing protein [bacterium]|nr:DUF2569 domain-containing protein [Akkermansiaceae bacterium]MDB4266337.1 DUF2569 domain-containing protein [bacterium]MDA7648948.1 DUF2569 domain-containing protein [Akkermansiaceae bacterium]MDA7862597.1 DUF2569 domain-containing protein [Akkermansiaceae bacterium]MDA7863590.1 DUF2569 domain-containing protein [Akkermansiaceae bacterium]
MDPDSYTLFSGYENENMLQVTFAFGTFSAPCVLVLSILQLILLFSRRTSFPWMLIGFAVFVLLIDAGYLYLSEMTWAEEETADVLQIPRVVLWSAYMVVSVRVKTTFTSRSKKKQVASPPPLPE